MRVRIELIDASHEIGFSEWMASENETFSFVKKSIADANSISNLFAGILRRNLQADFEAWIVFDEARNIVGYIELKRTEKTDLDTERELIYVVKKKYRNMGYATTAVSIVLQASQFSVVAFVGSENRASICVLKRNGFEKVLSLIHI